MAGKVMLHYRDLNCERIFIDDTGGYGSSVVDCLSLYPEIDVTPIKFNAKAQEPQRYRNCRTEMWLRMRDWIVEKGALKYDRKLVQELCNVKVTFKGSIAALEEKQQVKLRIGRSPDRADALGLTFADIEQPSSNQEIFHEGRRPFGQQKPKETDWDDYEYKGLSGDHYKNFKS